MGSRIDWESMLPKIEEMGEMGMPEKYVPQCLGINRDTYRKYKNRESEFREAFQRGQGRYFQKLIKALTKQVDEGDPQSVKFAIKAQMKLYDVPEQNPQQADAAALLAELLGRLPK